MTLCSAVVRAQVLAELGVREAACASCAACGCAPPPCALCGVSPDSGIEFDRWADAHHH